MVFIFLIIIINICLTIIIRPTQNVNTILQDLMASDSFCCLSLRGLRFSISLHEIFQYLFVLIFYRITDEYRFCCMARHVSKCLPLPDEFSSCEDLMSNPILRMCIWIIGMIALIGNLVVIMWRVNSKRDNKVREKAGIEEEKNKKFSDWTSLAISKAFYLLPRGSDNKVCR